MPTLRSTKKALGLVCINKSGAMRESEQAINLVVL
jgi:hypothetical protein